MPTQVVSPGDMFQGGRVTTPDPSLGRAYLRFAGIITTDLYEFHFPTGSATGLTFGIPLSVFVDNSLNSFEVDFAIMGTRQTFPVPANSTGWYVIETLPGSTINMQSLGVPSGPIEVIFYNYEQTPFVYYKFGPNTVSNISIPNGADVTQGNTGDAAQIDPTQPATLVAVLKGILSRVLGIGSQADATVTNPATNASLISFTRGILTGINSLVNSVAAFSYTHVTASGVNAIKPSPGILSGITINNAVAGTVTVYDNTSGSGTVVAIINTGTIGSVSFAGGRGITMATGITINQTAAADLTVAWR